MENSLSESGLTPEDYQLLYSVATQKSAIGDYASAIKILHFLAVRASSEQVKYMKALAGCFHYQENFEGAIHFYLRCYINDPEINADCLLFTADCLMKLNRFQEAYEILDILLNECGNNLSYAQLIAKAKMLHRVASKKS